MKKKILGFIICMAILIGVIITMFVNIAFAADTASGDGWFIDGNGCLHITGHISRLTKEEGGNSGYTSDSSDSSDYDDSSSGPTSGLYHSFKTPLSAAQPISGASGIPWNKYSSEIKSVVTEPGASVDDCNWLFFNCRNMISADLSNLDTSGVTEMKDMFCYCEALTDINFGGMDTSSVTDMSYMFAYCYSLENLDLRNFNTSNVEDMGYMFDGCTALKNLNLSGFNTAKVKNMQYMFYECSSLEKLDLSSFSTEKLRTMSNMFRGCTSLKALNLSNFVTPLLDQTDGAFKACSSLEVLDIGNLTFSGFNPVDVLYGCTKLKKLTINSQFLKPIILEVMKISDIWSNAKTSEQYTSYQQLGSLSGTVTLYKGIPQSYGVWIASVQVTDANADDVLFDGGSVKYYPKGEYTGKNAVSGYEYGTNAATLVFNKLDIKTDDFSVAGTNRGQIYITEDVNIVLKGGNNLYKGGNANGIYIKDGKYVWFYGDGALNIDTSLNDYDAIRGSSPSLFFYENVKVNLTGAHAIYYEYNKDVGDDFLDIHDNANVSCYSKRTSTGSDYYTVTAPFLTVQDNGIITAEAQYNSVAIDTWGDEFYNTDYEIKILKEKEFVNSGTQPYTPTLGLNVSGGVYEEDCRYISITPKHTNPTVINKIEITNTVTTPMVNEKAGENLGYLLPDNAHYTITEQTWFNEGKGFPLTDDDKFVWADIYSKKYKVRANPGYAFTKDTVITINGTTDTIDSDYLSFDEKTMTYTIWTKPAEAKKKNYKLSGTVTSYDNVNIPNGTVTVSVFTSGSDTILSSATVTDTKGTYAFNGLVSGDYVIKFEKPGHASRTYKIKMANSDVTLNASLQHICDINGDGLTDKKDLNALKKHINESVILSDYKFTVADINKDGYADKKDLNALKKHINEAVLLY